MLLLLGWALAVVLLLGGLYLLSLRQDYLLVFRWYGRPPIVLQATRNGRYQMIPPWMVPVALMGFVAHLFAIAAAAADEWANPRHLPRTTGAVAKL